MIGLRKEDIITSLREAGIKSGEVISGDTLADTIADIITKNNIKIEKDLEKAVSKVLNDTLFKKGIK